MTLGGLAALVPSMQGRAAALDEAEAYPAEDMEALRATGALCACLPTALGGQGSGTEPKGALPLLGMLRLIGRGNLSVGRLFEAHVNAVRLVCRYGTPAQAERLARDVAAGQVLGLWVTDAPGEPLTLKDGTLRGSKGPCSGAGFVDAAVVTVATAEGIRLAVLPLRQSEHVTPLRGVLHGMRAAVNGTVRFDGVPCPASALFGVPGDYLREPDFSAGAWRTSAVTLGGLEALVDIARQQLVQRGHGGSVPQQERFGRAWIAQETAALWLRRAAEAAEDESGPAAARVAYVNLARIAVETACLDAIRLVQRSLGFAAFLRPNPAERLARDLGTYLRQPAPDAVLTEAAEYFLRGGAPP